MGAQAETRCQKTSSVAGVRGRAGPRARAADDLSAQGSGLCARQAKGSSHAPEIPTPTPAVNLRFNIDGLTKGRERVGGFLVGEVMNTPLTPLPSRDIASHRIIRNRKR